MRRSIALWPGLALVAIFLMCGQACAQITAGAISLQIAPGARADGMGTAYTALANDGYANWWNPAGLAFLGEDLGSTGPPPGYKGVGITFSQLVPGLFDDVYYSYATYSQKLGDWGGFGVSVPFITYGEIPIVVDDGETGLQVDTHTPAEFAAGFGYGTRLRENLSFGAGVKVYRMDLAPKVLDPSIDLPEGATGTTFAADVGGLYRSKALPLAVGVSMLNLGPDITFVKARESSPLPRVLKVGAAYRIYEWSNSSILGAFDLTKPFVELRDEIIWGGGVEYALAWGKNGNLALRAGYYSEREGDIEDPTFGLGIGWGGIRYDFVSFPQSSVLDYVSRHSIQISWQ